MLYREGNGGRSSRFKNGHFDLRTKKPTGLPVSSWIGRPSSLKWTKDAEQLTLEDGVVCSFVASVFASPATYSLRPATKNGVLCAGMNYNRGG